ncbi:chromosome segregation protein spc25 domain-containing protein [Phthorimaea operculella]|nr:chromosome segregation protein spc25 domain-containing protein [Phthorimaea operculella]
MEFDTRINSLRNEVLNLNGFKKQMYDNNDISPSHDEELKTLIEKNKQLRNEIDKKLEELNKQKSEYETYKQDQKLLSQEIKDTHEAFLMAKKFYKKNLKIYYTIETRSNEKQTIYLQFFTEAKKECENYSIRLLRNTKTEHYELLETKPKLKKFDELKTTLQETNDVPGVLCDIREAFLKIKNKKS